MSGATKIETKEKNLLDCTLQEVEKMLEPLSDDDRERVASKMWNDYRKRLAEA